MLITIYLFNQVLVAPGFGRDVRSIQPPKCLPTVETMPVVKPPIRVLPRERKISASASPTIPPPSPSKKTTFDASRENPWVAPPTVQRTHEASPKHAGKPMLCSWLWLSSLHDKLLAANEAKRTGLLLDLRLID